MTAYVKDAFGRSPVATGWGSPGVGGTWSHGYASGNGTSSTDGQNGRATWTAGTNAAFIYHRLGTAPSVMACAASFRFRGTAVVSDSYWVELILRSTGATTAQSGYLIRAGPHTDGKLQAQILRGTPGGTEVVLATLPSPPTVGTNAWWVVEAELIGANPTRVRARWFHKTSIPTDDTGWTEVTDSTGPQGAGVIGFSHRRNGSGLFTAYVDEVYQTDVMVPSFVGVPDAIDGLVVRFDPDTSTGEAVLWEWAFGDGTTSTERYPTHAYATPATYNVTLTLTTLWGTKRAVTQSVEVTGEPLEPPDRFLPDVFLDGVNVCDRVFSAAWKNGRDRWPEDVVGSSLTLNLRGRFPDVTMGSRVVIQLPPGAPDGTVQLWTGMVDSVVESIDPVDSLTTTTIVAMDVLNFLGRWHILPDSDMPEQTLPSRLLELQPRSGIAYRQKWAGVPAGRWPTLKALTMSADKLRSKTYLDLLRDGMRGSIATAHMAKDGVIVYAPLDAPLSVTPPVIALDEGPDCPSEMDVDRSTADGLVNRWTVGEGNNVDRVERSSIEAYGESGWNVATGVLKTESTFPVTDTMANAMQSPFSALRATIPILDWAARSYLAEPLDMVGLGGVLYGILGVSHDVTLDGWTVELSLDRDPWTLTGTTPPVTPPTVKTRTQTFGMTKDALLASPNMGAGASTRNAIGLWGGTKFRMLIQPNLQYTSKPLKVTSAKLRLWTAGQDMCAYGSTPQVHIDRITGGWSEGSSGGHGPPWTFNTSNAVVWPGPSATTSGRRSQNVTNAEQTLVEFDVTAIVNSWAQGSKNYGFRIISQNEGSTSRTIEFHTSESPTSSRRPELVVTYQYTV